MKARDLYSQALLRLNLLVQRDGIRNGRIFYDLGNVYYRLGDIGRAILSYRRAELYAPVDQNLLHNLAFVRSKRKDSLPVPQSSPVLQVLFFWHFDMSVRLQAIVLAVSFGIVWLFLAIRLFWRRRWMMLPVWTGAVVAALFVGSLIWSQIHLASTRAGVVVAPSVVARKGDAISYDPAFKSPLHAGDEFSLLTARPGWYCIELTDGATAWVPRASVRLVRPLPSG